MTLTVIVRAYWSAGGNVGQRGEFASYNFITHPAGRSVVREFFGAACPLACGSRVIEMTARYFGDYRFPGYRSAA
ncbi:hypothetical protein [Paraburkholderia sacchari]|uniref:hypothetical protein n=1 Tax=Paraburkholderia sacchari TaxID=159450 RepID=UPI000543E2D3|nr:hypothetical protein [Paraburkholderia sacchari]NLP65139.1 hypothetical protein [Paraburkholderia sacchari]